MKHEVFFDFRTVFVEYESVIGEIEITYPVVGCFFYVVFVIEFFTFYENLFNAVGSECGLGSSGLLGSQDALVVLGAHLNWLVLDYWGV